MVGASLPQRVLLELVKIKKNESRDKFDFQPLSEEDWFEIMEESINHSVALYAFDSLKNVEVEIPESVKTKWKNIALAVFSQNFKVLDEQKELVDILDKESIDYIILKGTASASYYPDFEKRSFGDVDFLIDPEKKAEIEKILIANGYVCTLEDYVCHTVFEKNGVQFEMHYEIVGLPGGKSGELFRSYMNGAEKLGFKNLNPVFFNPLPQIHAVILLLHTIHHLIDEGIGLRHLCDWAYFIDNTHDEPFWEDDIVPLLKKTGTLKFAAILTKTSSVYLNSHCFSWARDVDDLICADLICDILELGNFGRSNKTRSISGKVISNRETNSLQNNKKKYLKNKFNSLYKRSINETRIKIFFPFVFFWNLFKTIILMFFGKKTSVLKTYSYAEKRTSIYKAFELFVFDED